MSAEEASELLNETVGIGDTVLLQGPDTVGKRAIAENSFTFGPEKSEYLIISTREDFSAIRNRIPNSIRENVSIVNCSGEDSETESNTFGKSVSSPGDLMGIGIEISNWMEDLPEEAIPNVMFDSISVIQMYRDEKTICRFLRSIMAKVSNQDGRVLVLSGGVPTDNITELFDYVFEFRETDTDREYRFVTNELGETTDWVSLTSGDEDKARIPSIRELHTKMRDEGETLYLYTSNTEAVEFIRDHFFSVSVSQEVPTDEKAGVAELRICGITLETSDIDEMRTYIATKYSEYPLETVPDVIQYIEHTKSQWDEYSREDTILPSRKIETRMKHNGFGELHSGFQKFSTLKNSPNTLQYYRRLAEDTEVEVHIYGINDADLTGEDFIVHSLSPDSDLAAYWFLVSEYGDVLLCEENADGETYSGFWVSNQNLARAVMEYTRSL